MAKSTDNKMSRYVQGGTTEVFKNRLGIWDRFVLPYQDDDITIIVRNEHVDRPYLIAYEVYGTPDLMWLVFQYNNILDPTVEIISGMELRLPSPSRVALNIITG